jgi:hypothetical protein
MIVIMVIKKIGMVMVMVTIVVIINYNIKSIISYTHYIKKTVEVLACLLKFFITSCLRSSLLLQINPSSPHPGK